MRGLLMVLPVLLATLFQPACSSITSNSSMNIKDHPDILANVEASLLSLFGFRKRPRPDKIVVPEAMLEMYRQQTGLDVDTSALPLPGRHTQTANTVRSFSHVVSSTDGKFPSQNKFRLSFDVKSIPKIEKLKAAEVQLNREAVTTEAGKKTPLSEVSSTDKVNTLPDSDAQKTIVKEKNETTNATTKATRRKVPSRRHLLRILVHDILKPGIRGRRKPIFRLIDSKVIDIRDSEAIMVDVLPAVERWLDNPKENYGLLIEVMPVDATNNSSKNLNHVRLRRAADEDDQEWHPKQPLLLTFTDDGKNKVRTAQEIVNRTRRTPQAMKRAAAQSKRRGRENCRRYPLYVDFQDVGWNDWIVAPPGYDAYYCHGDCPFPLADHLNSTNHAIVQTLVNSVNPSAVPKACCVPTSLTSISMLYLDEESKVVLKNYQDMAVIGCGCR